MNARRVLPVLLGVVGVVASGAASLAQSQPGAETDLSNPLWSTPLDRLNATRERPLFAPTRRPPAPTVAAAPVQKAPQAAPPPPEPPPFTLIGTALGEEDTVALLFDQTTNKAISLRVGASASRWLLKSVKRRSVEIERDGVLTVLSLAEPTAGAGYAMQSSPASSLIMPAPAATPIMPGAANAQPRPRPGLPMPSAR